MFNNHNDRNDHGNLSPIRTLRTNRLPWLLVAVMGLLLVYQYATSGVGTNVLSLLPLLGGLICPLMMLFMMSGHGHGIPAANDTNQDQNDKHGCCAGHRHNQNK